MKRLRALDWFEETGIKVYTKRTEKNNINKIVHVSPKRLEWSKRAICLKCKKKTIWKIKLKENIAICNECNTKKLIKFKGTIKSTEILRNYDLNGKVIQPVRKEVKNKPKKQYITLFKEKIEKIRQTKLSEMFLNEK